MADGVNEGEQLRIVRLKPWEIEAVMIAAFTAAVTNSPLRDKAVEGEDPNSGILTLLAGLGAALVFAAQGSLVETASNDTLEEVIKGALGGGRAFLDAREKRAKAAEGQSPGGAV